MDIGFKTKKLGKSFDEDFPKFKKHHGARRSELIKRRMTALLAAKCLKDLWLPQSGPERCHEVSGGSRIIKISIDLDHPYRLIFEPNHNPLPMRDEGGLDWSQVTAITILGIKKYS